MKRYGNEDPISALRRRNWSGDASYANDAERARMRWLQGGTSAQFEQMEAAEKRAWNRMMFGEKRFTINPYVD